KLQQNAGRLVEIVLEAEDVEEMEIKELVRREYADHAEQQRAANGSPKHRRLRCASRGHARVRETHRHAHRENEGRVDQVPGSPAAPRSVIELGAEKLYPRGRAVAEPHQSFGKTETVRHEEHHYEASEGIE